VILRSELLAGVERPGQVLRGNMDFLAFTGGHPEELRRRGPIRALPVVSGVGFAAYVLFTEEAGDKFVVWHATLEQRKGNPPSTTRVPLSEGAWKVARSRLQHREMD
jgi:hypothetical protein